MEQSIQDLINSIKKDGIESATNESKRIIEEAQKKAEQIIAEAERKRDKLLSDSMKEIEKEKERNNESLKMAARDLALTFKKDTENKINAILTDKVQSAFDTELLKSLILLVVKAEFEGDVTVVLSDKDKGKISASLLKELANELERGVSLLFSKDFNGGFVIKAQDGKSYIDLTDDEVSKLLYPYLSSNIRERI